MKKSIQRILTFLALLASGSGASASAGEDVVRRAVYAFAEAGDRQDVERLEELLDPGFRVAFVKGEDAEAVVLPRAQYLALIAEKKLGGSPREVKIGRIHRVGSFAFADVVLTRQDARFDGLMTLVQSGGTWRLLEDATHMTVKELR